jgi:hypothetical protein
MTLEGDGYYTYTITGFTSLPIGVVFNNGSTSSMQQTVDLFADEDKCWDSGVLTGGKYTAIEVPCPSIGLEDQPEADWSIFPNPTQGLVNLTAPGKYTEVSVSSASGRLLMIKPVWTSNNCQLDLSGYPSGVYYITLSGSDGSRATKMVLKN